MSDTEAILGKPPMEGGPTSTTGKRLQNIFLGDGKGLSVGMGAVFIVGTMCGSGILALPKALVDAGYAGIPLLIICGCVSSYTGNLLGKCWTILRKRYPRQYSDTVADPYPAIGYRAAGKFGWFFTHFCIVATLFGGATVFLLLISGNISILLFDIGHVKMHACYWIMIIAALLTPLTWLGTPKDFWQAGLIAAVTTTLGAILIVIGLGEMTPTTYPHHSNPSFDSFFTAFGTILFAFGGASCFPTIQVDMKDPDKFPVSVVIGIIAVLCIYIPVSVSGFVVLGDDMTKSNILEEMNANWILYAIIILITSHLFMAFLIVLNPINQALESALGVESKFSLKRVAARSGVMLVILFVALTVPQFGIVLSLIGGTTVTATNFIFPPTFYLLLAGQKRPEDAHGPPPEGESTVFEEREDLGEDQNEEGQNFFSEPTDDRDWLQIEIPFHVKVLLCEIIFIGLFGGLASTYSVIRALINGSSGFTVPCYVNWASADS